MLNVLIVDDDAMVAELNRLYVARVPGFRCSGSASTLSQAQEMINDPQQEIDLVLLFTDPNTTDPWDDAQMIETIRHCDRHNVPIATNLASAEMLIMGLQRGDLDWREMLHNKNKF